MVDIVDTSVDVQDLLPTHGEFIAHAVSEALGLGEAAKRSILGWNFLFHNSMSLEGDQYPAKNL